MAAMGVRSGPVGDPQLRFERALYAADPVVEMEAVTGQVEDLLREADRSHTLWRTRCG